MKHAPHQSVDLLPPWIVKQKAVPWRVFTLYKCEGFQKIVPFCPEFKRRTTTTNVSKLHWMSVNKVFITVALNWIC